MNESTLMTVHTTHVQSEFYKWVVLTLAAFTFTFVVAIPSMSLPVLFDEISADLGLSLVQVGWIWGIGSVLGILVGLIGGPIGDRFGPRRTLAVACLFVGIAGGARGLSNGFTMLAITTLFNGFVLWSIPMNVHKICGVWFRKEQLGMANSIVSVGMALGFLLGSLLAATVFSPLFGGWRNVLFVYGAVAILFGTFFHSIQAPKSTAIWIKSPTATIRNLGTTTNKAYTTIAIYEWSGWKPILQRLGS
ncbi:MAG: MFS transporter [Deltaproteobacteria bacterium]|nr:MFS transporter [Deltaproteobacteria bacterium]